MGRHVARLVVELFVLVPALVGLGQGAVVGSGSGAGAHVGHDEVGRHIVLGAIGLHADILGGGQVQSAEVLDGVDIGRVGDVVVSEDDKVFRVGSRSTRRLWVRRRAGCSGLRYGWDL